MGFHHALQRNIVLPFNTSQRTGIPSSRSVGVRCGWSSLIPYRTHWSSTGDSRSIVRNRLTEWYRALTTVGDKFSISLIGPHRSNSAHHLIELRAGWATNIRAASSHLLTFSFCRRVGPQMWTTRVLLITLCLLCLGTAQETRTYTRTYVTHYLETFPGPQVHKDMHSGTT